MIEKKDDDQAKLAHYREEISRLVVHNRRGSIWTTGIRSWPRR